MVTFICPLCGVERTGKRRRCYQCTVRHSPESRERIRRALTGVSHTAERREANSRGHLGLRHTDEWKARMKGRRPPNWQPPGTVRVSNGHTQVKCDDGRWRYRARVMWEQANGPIPRGRLIHHVNHDPHDDRLENFQLVTVAEHMRIHMLANDSEKAVRLARLRNRNR